MFDESPPATRPAAESPEDLGRFFVERANAGDVEGLVALYEPAALIAFPYGDRVIGHDAIRLAYAKLLAVQPRFAPGVQRPALVNGDLALTSTLTTTGTMAEIARRQRDGSWRWVVDDPAIAR
ncbi:MAG: nuclear transport factor 2 family protein [Candidatus Dormiibacterota bacterium]